MKILLVFAAAAAILASCSLFAAAPSSRPSVRALYSDTFTGQPTWRQSSTSQRTFANVKGGYEISTSKPATWWFAPCPFTLDGSFDAPYAVSVKARVISGSTDGAFGVVFDYVDSKNFKWLAINRSGEYQLGTFDSGRARIIRDWTVDTAIRTGSAANKVTIYQYPNRLEVDVNGAQVTTDSSVPLPGQPFEIKLMAYNYDSMNRGVLKALFESVAISRIE